MRIATSVTSIPTDSAPRTFQALWLGTVEYAAAWQLQRELVSLRQASRIPDILLLLEHPRTLTLGRSSVEAHLLAPREELLALGFSIHDVDRGGEVTYHGPGQLVGYPIFDLRNHGQDLHLYIRKMEAALIQALESFGIRGIRNPAHTGVWVEDRKIAAIGIKVSRWVASHGFALNITTDLTDFDAVIPCGIRDKPVTSIAAEIGISPDLLYVIPPILSAFTSVFNCPIVYPRGSDGTADSSTIVPSQNDSQAGTSGLSANRADGVSEAEATIASTLQDSPLATRVCHPEGVLSPKDLLLALKTALSPESAKIIDRAIDAFKIPVLDYAPLSGDIENHGSSSSGN
jgi:lipoyl(octanoyl) transferase